MPFPSSLQWLGLGLEVTRGTAVNPTWFFPIESPQWTPNIIEQDDKGLRGDMNAIHDQIATLRFDGMDWQNNVMLDTIPALIRAALGSPDVKTGTAPPYSHAFSLLNNSASGQPPSYTAHYFDGLELQTIAGCQLNTLDFDFTADGLLIAKSKLIGMPAVIGTAALGTFTAEEAVPAYDCTVSVGGTPITKLVSGTITLNRGAKPIPAITGSQAYYQNWAGPLDMAGSKLTVIMESDVELNYFLNNTKGIPVDLKFVNPVVAGEFLLIHCSTPAWKTGKKNPGKEWMEVDLEMHPLPNATDATAGGTSPCKITAANAIATAF